LAWEELSDQRLYKPLSMSSTSSRFADYMARENRAIPHVKRDDKWQVTPTQRDPDPESPAGGASSNVIDLSSWLRLQLGQGTFEGSELIPAAALAPMHIPQSVANPPADPSKKRAGFYGFGVDVSYTNYGTPQWGHSGAFNLGASTAYYMLPASGFGIVALTNGNPVGVPESVTLTVLDIVQGAPQTTDWLAILGPYMAGLLGPTYGVGNDTATAPDPAAPALPNDAYAGTYANDLFGEVEIVSSGDGLLMRIGPKPMEFALTHFDRDTFFWQPPGENAYGLSALTFNIGVDGKASGFDDEYLATGGPGTLTRTGGVPE
jgi:hypothetical protein